MFGSALFSVDDIFTRLQNFRTSLSSKGPLISPLYFAKVDVKSCFDTIPQKRLLSLAKRILSANEYHITRYSRAKLLGGHNQETPGFGAKPSWKYLTKATAESSGFNLDAEIHSESVAGRTRTAYVGGVVKRSEYRQVILDLLHEHVQSNVVKLGNRFYRQKEGIPQGSILSSLLCSYFYGELETSALSFVKNESSLLMRLIDDFLIITTDHHVAETFMRIMHAGLPEFGVQVKADKSRVNFDIDIDGSAIDRLPAETDFPYCGNAINTITLDLSKDMQRRKANDIPDSITVEYSKLPGQTFYRKTLNALKLHMRTMHLSTSYNSVATVFANLYFAFNEVAQKSYSYIKSMPSSKQPASELLISKSLSSLARSTSKLS
jgi:telomerase reverse transcriptase